MTLNSNIDIKRSHGIKNKMHTRTHTHHYCGATSPLPTCAVQARGIREGISLHRDVGIFYGAQSAQVMHWLPALPKHYLRFLRTFLNLKRKKKEANH
jgi:hypothetical protein